MNIYKSWLKISSCAGAGIENQEYARLNRKWLKFDWKLTPFIGAIFLSIARIGLIFNIENVWKRSFLKTIQKKFSIVWIPRV